MSKKDHDLLGLLRTRVERPTGGSARESSRGRAARGSVRATSFPAPPPSPLPPAAPATPLLQRVTALLQKLQEHVVLTRGFLAACGALLVFLCLAVYLVGYRRGENHGREAALAQDDIGEDAARRPKNSPLDVRVPKTMQDPGISQLLADQDGRRPEVAKDKTETAPPAAPGAAQGQPPAPPKTRYGLRLITYPDTVNGRGRAADMLRYLREQGIADVKLVQENKDGMLSVLVLVADGSKETAKVARNRVRALAPPPFDKSYEFAKQELVLVSY